jgi:hypothetical protein
MAALKVALDLFPLNLVADAGARVSEYILRDRGLWSGSKSDAGYALILIQLRRSDKRFRESE